MEGQNASMIGQIIGGRYRLTKLLGEGGMGAVYAAEHINITKTVAVKLLHLEISSNQEAVTRFRQEAQSASSIGHPNIIGIDDFFTMEDGRVCLIMEFLKGESLSDRMQVPGGLDPHQAIDLMVQVCEGLEAAHEKGIIHRDMKPENVYIAQAHGREVVKILDFGIAKVTGNEDNNLTKTGTVFGTPHYMSPEQALGHKVDVRADVYSVGVMLFEIFTGQVPFQAESFMGVLSQHITKPTPAPSTFTPGRPVPSMMDDIILTAMAKEVDKRFASMGALMGALRAFEQALKGPDGAKVVTGKVSAADVAAAAGLGLPPGAPTPAPAAPAEPAIAPTMASMSGPAAAPAAPTPGAPPPGAVPTASGSDAAIPRTMMASGPQAAAVQGGQLPPSSPSVPVVPSPAPSMAPPKKQKKKSKTGLIIGLVVALLVLGGGGAAAAIFWDDIMGNKDPGGGTGEVAGGSGEGTAAGSAQAKAPEADSGAPAADAAVAQKDPPDQPPKKDPGGTVATKDPKDPPPDDPPKKDPGSKKDPVHVAKKDPVPKKDPVVKKDPPKKDPVPKKDPPKKDPVVKKDPPKPKDCVVTLSTSPSRASILPPSGGFRRLGKTPKKFKLKAGETKRVKIAKSGRRSVTVTLSCDRTKHHIKLRKGFNPGIGGGGVDIPGGNL